MATKACKECGAEKEANTENFTNTPANSDGLSGKCKECLATYARKRWREKQGKTAASKEDRIAMIKKRQDALKQKTAPEPPQHVDAPRPMARKPASKKRKARKMVAKGHPFVLESDRLMTEMIDIANVIKNGKVLLRQKCEQLLAVLNAEGHGQGND